MAVALLLLDVLHKVVEDVLGLQLLLLGLASLAFLEVQDLALVFQTGLQVIRLDLAGDEISVHSLEHVLVGALVHVLVLDLVGSLVESLVKVHKSLLVVGNGALDLGFLNLETGDFLADLVVLLLLEGDLLLGLVMLLLDLAELHGHLVDLLLVVLLSCGVVCRLEQSVLLNESVRSVIDLEFLLHDGATRACEIFGAGHTFASVTVHLTAIAVAKFKL